MLLINGESVGIEIETEFSSASFVSEFRPTHDASIISDGFYLNNLRDIFLSERNIKMSLLFGMESREIGVEYVSGILRFDEDNISDILSRFYSNLIESGESIGLRSGIHYHVNMQHCRLSAYKNLLKLWLRYEDLIYLLAGMGREYRGYSNNSAYSRPLSGEGIFVPYRNSYVQLVEIDQILQTKNIEDFFTAFGDSFACSSVRYYPVRYYGLNLSNVINRGSVEFRPFNATLNYKWVYSCLDFCKALVEYSIMLSIKKEKFLPTGENINSVYNPRSKSEIISDLFILCRELELSSETYSVLENICKISEIPTLNPIGIRTHLSNRYPAIWKNTKYSPTIYKENPLNATIDDIHRRRGDR